MYGLRAYDVDGFSFLVAHFKVAANAPAGPGMASGKLKYQACNNRACFAPKTIDIAIPYQIQ